MLGLIESQYMTGFVDGETLIPVQIIDGISNSEFIA
jgi:hypothetical protein